CFLSLLDNGRRRYAETSTEAIVTGQDYDYNIKVQRSCDGVDVSAQTNKSVMSEERYETKMRDAETQVDILDLPMLLEILEQMLIQLPKHFASELRQNFLPACGIFMDRKNLYANESRMRSLSPTYFSPESSSLSASSTHEHSTTDQHKFNFGASDFSEASINSSALGMDTTKQARSEQLKASMFPSATSASSKKGKEPINSDQPKERTTPSPTASTLNNWEQSTRISSLSKESTTPEVKKKTKKSKASKQSEKKNSRLNGFNNDWNKTNHDCTDEWDVSTDPAPFDEYEILDVSGDTFSIVDSNVISASQISNQKNKESPKIENHCERDIQYLPVKSSGKRKKKKSSSEDARVNSNYPDTISVVINTRGLHKKPPLESPGGFHREQSGNVQMRNEKGGHPDDDAREFNRVNQNNRSTNYEMKNQDEMTEIPINGKHLGASLINRSYQTDFDLNNSYSNGNLIPKNNGRNNDDYVQRSELSSSFEKDIRYQKVSHSSSTNGCLERNYDECLDRRSESIMRHSKNGYLERNYDECLDRRSESIMRHNYFGYSNEKDNSSYRNSTYEKKSYRAQELDSRGNHQSNTDVSDDDTSESLSVRGGSFRDDEYSSFSDRQNNNSEDNYSAKLETTGRPKINKRASFHNEFASIPRDKNERKQLGRRKSMDAWKSGGI
ncbi:9998_t:CDS:2, partial [Acaulospora colombiana]